MSAAKDLFIKVLTRARDATKSKSGLFGLLSDNTITVTNLLFSAVVIGLQKLLSTELFDCPLENHVCYGVMFLVTPFVIVLIMNILLIGDVWKVTDRCCVSRYRRRFDCLRLTPNICKSFVGPSVWLIASFVDGKYVACLAVGQDIEKRNLTDNMEIKKLEEEFANAKAWSHILAWIVFLVLVLGTAVIMTTKKCCLKDNVLLEDEYILDRREAVAAMLTFRDFIEHPSDHGDDVGTEPSKAGTSAQPFASVSSKSGAGAPIATSTKPVIKSAPVASVSAGASATDITVLSDDTEGNLSRGKDKTKDETDGKQVKESLCTKVWRWFTANKKEGEQKDNVEKDEEQDITGRFIGKEEEITIYPEGIPEQTGKKYVEKLFVDWSTNRDWDYHKVYGYFKDKYPRVTTGRPKDPWVRRDNRKEVDSQKGPQDYSRVSSDSEAEAMSSV